MTDAKHNLEVTSQPQALLLRVIAGLQRGAEMPLRLGSYLIGSGEDCDIVLADDGIADEHLSIEITPEGLLLRACNEPVVFADTLLRPGLEASADAPIAIGLGESHLGVGGPDTDWAALPRPDFSAALALAEEREAQAAARSEGEESAGAPPEERSIVSDETATSSSSGAASSQDALQQAENADSWEHDSATAPDGATAEDPAAMEDGGGAPNELGVSVSPVLDKITDNWRAAAAAAMLLFAGATIICVRFAAGGGFSQAGASQIAEAENTKTLDTVREILADAGLDEVAALEVRTGEYRLSGFIANEAARDKMHALLRKARISFVDKTRQVDQIMRAVEYSLDAYHWPSAGFRDHLIASYGVDGVVVIDGFLGPEVDRTDLNRRIITDTPGIVRVDFKRARLSDWQTELNAELKRAGLGAWLQTDTVEGTIRISGELTPKESEAWRNVGEAFVKESRGWPKLTIAVRAAGVHTLQSPDEAEPVVIASSSPAPEVKTSRPAALNIIGVILSSNGPGRVLLNNGTSRAEGEALIDGDVVQSVTLNKVLIGNGDNGVEYHVGESG